MRDIKNKQPRFKQHGPRSRHINGCHCKMPSALLNLYQILINMDHVLMKSLLSLPVTVATEDIHPTTSSEQEVDHCEPRRKDQTSHSPPISSIQLILQICQMPDYGTFSISQGSLIAFSKEFPKRNSLTSKEN